MDNNHEKQANSVISTFNSLKLTFNKLKKIKKKLTLQDYLEELSPYADKLLEDLETEITKYEKGFCNIKFNTEQDMIELTFVMIFKHIDDGDIEKKELKRYIDKNIFQKDVIREIGIRGQSFEIKKG